MKRGFTLIELAIVLVIIGLIAGGIVVGKDLIAASKIRATISQYEQFQTAVYTFKNKYGGLPGDLLNPTRFGLAASTETAAVPRGDSVLDMRHVSGGTYHSYYGAGKETTRFWHHLSVAGLIEETLLDPGADYCCNGHELGEVFPRAKLGGENYWIVWSRNNINYYSMRGLSSAAAYITTSQTTPAQLHGIDSKIDNGLPHSGKIINARNGPGGNYVDLIGHAANCTTGATATSTWDLSEANIDRNTCTGLRFNFD